MLAERKRVIPIFRHLLCRAKKDLPTLLSCLLIVFAASLFCRNGHLIKRAFKCIVEIKSL